MAKAKYDGVIETVHYGPDGQVAYVRAFLRRGPIFSDRVLIQRAELVKRLRAGERFVVGHRVSQMAGTFEVRDPLRLELKNGQEVLRTGNAEAPSDLLEGVPLN